ncbi:MAG TPA: substrate-binding domain-containing protein [Herpetosiphonaceae bacterium]
MTNNTKRLTIRDIARTAGVSPSTVSRVLNSTIAVNEEKRAAVLAAIAELDYRPSTVAQGLARGKSTAIGVLTQDIASPFYGEILRGIEVGLRGSHYHAVIANGNWRLEDETEALGMLRSRQTDAIIVLGGLLPDAQLRRVAEQTPLVAVGRTIEGLEHHCLRVDDFAGGYMATRYLIELGHRQIAHVSGVAFHQDSTARQRGYQRALEEAGIAFDPALVVEGSYTEQSGLMAAETLLLRASRFTAIFAANDQMAYGLRLGFFRRGIRVPEDVSIVGFDNLAGSAYVTPPLTTIRLPNEDMGVAAAKAVLRLIDGCDLDLPQFGPELVIRESATLRR